MRSSPLILPLLLLGCAPASTSPPPPRSGPVTTQVVTAAGTYSVTSLGGEGATPLHVDLPLEQAWKALPAVYEVLGLDPGMVDPETHTVRVEDARVSRLDGERLSNFLDCGAAPVGGEIADLYSVRIDVWTRLQESVGETQVRTMVSGTARPRGTSGSPQHCTSTGVLETRIAELLAGPAAPDQQRP